MTKKQLAIAIPASVIADTPHLREKTSKIGCIGRAAAIFRVDEIIVYADDSKQNQRRDLEFIATLLRYMETPQYLRKRLFELKPELQYAGILPPLRTPHHPLKGSFRDLHVGDFREGVVVSKSGEGVQVDIGAEHPVSLKGDFAVNQRLTLKVNEVGRDTAEVQAAERSQIPEYWGFKVTVEPRSLRAVMEPKRFSLVIGTSKFAMRFQDVAESLRREWAKADSVLLVFGAPARGLFEIAQAEGVKVEDLVDCMVNTLPGQGTETVRTEEAVLATLAILNVEFGF